MGSAGGMRGGGGGAPASGLGGVGGASAVPAVRAELKAATGLEFTPNPGADLVTVAVDVGKVDAAWAKDRGYYVAPGGGGQKADNVRSFFAKAAREGIKVEQPRMTADPGGVSFTDGRHRFAVLRDMGVRSAVVSVPRSEAAAVRRKYGAR